MCGPFIQAVKEMERRKRIGKALRDSAKAYYRGKRVPIVSVNLTPDPKDVQREYDSLRVIGLNSCEAQAQAEATLTPTKFIGRLPTKIPGTSDKAWFDPAFIRAFSSKCGACATDLERDYEQFLILGHRLANAGKIDTKMVKRGSGYVRQFTVKLSDKMVSGPICCGVDWGARGDDTVVAVTKGDSRLSGAITPAPKHKYSKLAEHGTYVHRFGTPKERAKVENRVNEEIRRASETPPRRVKGPRSHSYYRERRAE